MQKYIKKVKKVKTYHLGVDDLYPDYLISFIEVNKELHLWNSLESRSIFNENVSKFQKMLEACREKEKN